MRVAAWALSGLMLVVACKREDKLDLSSPEKSIATFFKVLNDGRLADNLQALVVDGVEFTQWEMRCKHRGCERGEYKVLSRKDDGPDRVVLTVDYQVWGKRRERVSRGQRSPISLERYGDTWRFVQFGERIEMQTIDAGAADVDDVSVVNPSDATAP